MCARAVEDGGIMQREHASSALTLSALTLSASALSTAESRGLHDPRNTRRCHAV